MDKQFLFCVEANKQSATDYIYISETLKKYFAYDNHKTSVKPIYMGSKGKYNSKSVEKEISGKRTAFNGETVVIYCIDTDNYDRDYAEQKMYADIQKYCREKGYEFVWFCLDVEEVYLGKQIAAGKKVEEAKAFRMKQKIESVPEKNLKCREPNHKCSNVLLILEKYLNRK